MAGFAAEKWRKIGRLAADDKRIGNVLHWYRPKLGVGFGPFLRGSFGSPSEAVFFYAFKSIEKWLCCPLCGQQPEIYAPENEEVSV